MTELSIEQVLRDTNEHRSELSLDGKVTEGICLKNLLQDVSCEMVEAEGEDGCCIAFSSEEIQEGKIWLLPYADGPYTTCRLVCPEDAHRRRWCKNVKYIRLMEETS